jgi:AraC-like DNA-binding protein
MRNVDPATLASTSPCTIIARSSLVAPDFLVGENQGNGLIAARWRRRKVSLDEPVRLTDHVLSYCATGSATGSIITGGVRHDCVHQAGKLIFVPADQPVQWTLDSTADVVHIHLYVSKQAVARFAGDRPARPLRSFVAVHDRWLEDYFRLLISEYELCGRCGRLDESLFLDQTAGLLISRLLLAQADVSDRVPMAADMRVRVSALRPTIVGRVNEFVLENLSREIRLQQMADIAAFSVDHFVRAFRQATGVTPHRYVLELRLNHACDRLRNEPTPIAHIAKDCGFTSAARFSVAFHRRYGLTPSQYRNRH